MLSSIGLSTRGVTDLPCGWVNVLARLAVYRIAHNNEVIAEYNYSVHLQNVYNNDNIPWLYRNREMRIRGYTCSPDNDGNEPPGETGTSSERKIVGNSNVSLLITFCLQIRTQLIAHDESFYTRK